MSSFFCFMTTASNTITTKLTDSLKSITSNISTSVGDTVDEVIADTMDIMIDNTMSKLKNATIYDNSDTSNVKFEPSVPSGIDISQSSNWSWENIHNKEKSKFFTHIPVLVKNVESGQE